MTVEFARQGPQCLIQLSAAYPLLKTPVTGLIGWILWGQFSPLRPRAQNPQYPIEYCACVLRRPPPRRAVAESAAAVLTPPTLRY